jgi:uncharacterized protein
MRTDAAAIDYGPLDQGGLGRMLFYPRRESDFPPGGGRGENILIPVEKDIVVGARFHLSSSEAPNILFFHGNGEIVADYDDLAVIYADRGINFLPVDYRGYGRSTGMPTVTAMMRDCHAVFEYVQGWLRDRGHSGPFIVMGRSLGSASALELADSYGGAIQGVIIESGFADTGPLLALLGLSLEYLGITEKEGFRNTEKIGRFVGPTLVIHGEFDSIIPCAQGEMLYEASPSREKRFVLIPHAGHNDIFAVGLAEYFDGVSWLAEQARAKLAEG